MPVVPFTRQEAPAPAGPDIDEKYFVMAAADMHKEGRLFEGAQDPGHRHIDNIDKDPGLFQPIREDMQGKFKPEADQAKAMTKKMYDLYKEGDADVQATVLNWERKVLTRAYNDTDAGKALKKEAIEKYGSKGTLSEETMWEAFMSHYQNLIGDRKENDKFSAEERQDAEHASLFDRVGRIQMDMKPIYKKLR